MILIAHRGASFDAPENTLAAVRLAWEQQADAVEVDVQLSRDGELVVFHDRSTRRVAGVKRKVREQSLAELKKLDVGAWKAPRWFGEKIPTLHEVLEIVPPGKRLFVEVKCGVECAEALEQVVENAGAKAGQVTWISFSLPTLCFIKKRFPEMDAARIVYFRRMAGRWFPGFRKIVRQAQGAGLSGVDLSGNRRLSPALLERARTAQLQVYVWTVDKAKVARKLLELGIDGLTTNRPGWLRKQLQLSALRA